MDAVSKYTKKQHYVPQCYLKRFCNEAGNLEVFELRGARPFSTSPKNIASKRWLYESDSLETNTIEKILSGWESRLPIVLDKLVAGANSRLKRKRPNSGLITESEKAALIWLIALQMFRTPTFRGRFVGASDDEDEAHDFFLLCLGDPWRNLEVLEYWNSHHLTVARTPKGSIFWTSDHPVAAIFTEDRGNGLVAGEPTIFYPIDSNHMVILTPDSPKLGRPVRTFEATKEAVDCYNYQQAANCESQVYAAEKTEREINDLIRRWPEVADGHVPLEFRGEASLNPSFSLAPPRALKR